MNKKSDLDVIIIGGSYSGLAAAMALGRSLKNVLIIDSGKPCNKQTPHSHNFLTQDGKPPGEIAILGKQQVEKYETVQFLSGSVIKGTKIENGFEIHTDVEMFVARKLIFATGIIDILPNIDGIKECWGISVLHCPYCHGFEARNQNTGIIGNGERGFEFTSLISNWTKDLTLCTNGKSTLTTGQNDKLKEHRIKTIEKEIERFVHTNGHLQKVVFKDGSTDSFQVVYAPSTFQQHCQIPLELGCELTDEGYIKTDLTQKTNIYGIYACGDNASRLRTVANAVATGATAGMMVNKEIVLEQF
jgi:thioredoxin reductase